MNVFQEAEKLSTYLRKRREEGIHCVGFVPTMGALHQGHLTLVKQAMEECDLVVVSIFVNPTQFNDPSDLEKYPRPIGRDMELLLESGVDALFFPQVEEMYGSNYTSTQIDLGGLDEILEGAQRPGHFQGVANVVRRLFDIVEADRAYFGQKDFQQTRVIHQMKAHYHPKVELRIVPIVREANGLAMSSRNERLSSELRDRAGFIYRCLLKLKADIPLNGLDEALFQARRCLKKEEGCVLEYLDVVHQENLQPLDQMKEGQKAVVLVAVLYGGVRLLDNLLL